MTTVKDVYEDFREMAREALELELQYGEVDGPFEREFGSPIEAMLFWALAAKCQSRFDNITLYDGTSHATEISGTGVPILSGVAADRENPACLATQIGHRIHNNPEDYRVFSQCRIGKYKADFLVELWPYEIRVVVECDGHNYHERTKAQAAHDRSRDRYMQTRGLPVLRFTGSEINGSPSKCADQIIEFFEAARTKK